MLCKEHNNQYHSICINCMLERKEVNTEASGGKDGQTWQGWQSYPGNSEHKISWLQPLKDMVNSPSHYTQGSIECIDAIAEAIKHLKGMEAMCTGNVIKYMWRWKHKNGVEDLKKAQWYLTRMIDELDTN